MFPAQLLTEAEGPISMRYYLYSETHTHTQIEREREKKP
jgi:hypothetical protein